MSFDLWFAVPSNKNDLDIEEIRGWFRDRAHYDPENVTETQAIYENGDTGVYFIFEFGEVFDPDDAPDTKRPVIAVLLLNYLRPKFFAMESALEVQAFADRFGLEVCDPQEEEDDFTAFDQQKFVSSYSKHGSMVAKSMQENHSFAAKPMPSDKLEALWRWNFQKENLQARSTEDVFYPTIFVLEADGKLSTGIVWTDGIPTVIPPCDSIFLLRDELAQRKVLGIKFGGKKLAQLYPRRAFDRIFAEFYQTADEAGCLRPREFKRPTKLADILRNFDQPGLTPKRVAADAVIDEEFLV